jgi:RNA polymerase sigma-70 factor, ECF subfamily
VYARCGNASIAEELVGDVWLAVVERLPLFRPPSSGAYLAFTGWLYTIARYTVIRYYRQAKRTPVPLDDAVPASQPALDDVMMRDEEQHAIRNALEALTPEQREVVVLRFFDHRSSAEVARLTGRSEKAVKSLQHRAVAALARVLKLRNGTEG